MVYHQCGFSVKAVPHKCPSTLRLAGTRPFPGPLRPTSRTHAPPFHVRVHSPPAASHDGQRPAPRPQQATETVPAHGATPSPAPPRRYPGRGVIRSRLRPPSPAGGGGQARVLSPPPPQLKKRF